MLLHLEHSLVTDPSWRYNPIVPGSTDTKDIFEYKMKVENELRMMKVYKYIIRLIYNVSCISSNSII